MDIGDIVEFELEDGTQVVGYYKQRGNFNGMVCHRVSPYSDDRQAFWLREDHNIRRVA